MNILPHLPGYTGGTRVIMLAGRNKDGVAKLRNITRVSHSEPEFAKIIGELQDISCAGERIYAHAGPRHVMKAAQLFKHRQLDAAWEKREQEFYMSINARWVSCLSNSDCQDNKMWLFDCDSSDEWDMVMRFLRESYPSVLSKPYSYNTKNGWHVLVKPFNRNLMPDNILALLKTNPMMLWGY